MNRPANALLITLLLVAIATTLMADSSIAPDRRYSWGPNAGWLEWLPNDTDAPVFHETFAEGWVWSANVGWISLGDGSPADGVNYSNASADDFGVNVDTTSDSTNIILSGNAWSPNVGWLVFDVEAAAGEGAQPRINKITGLARGAVWSPNVGWLPLDESSLRITLQSKATYERWKNYM